MALAPEFGTDRTAAQLLLFAPNVNSYRRLVPDFDAPINVHWGRDNRTVGLRVPESGQSSRRVENRLAGADAKPVLDQLVTEGLATYRDLGNGTWRYEYAIYNQNLDRGIQSFTLPKRAGVTLTKAEVATANELVDAYNAYLTVVMADGSLEGEVAEGSQRGREDRADGESTDGSHPSSVLNGSFKCSARGRLS